MRIAVSAAGPMLEAQVDPRFGRCAYLVLVDPATFTFEVIENANAGSAQGAGIATAQSIAGKGAQVVLTGNCGPNAWQVLESAHMKVVTGVTGTVRDAVKAYVGGELRPGSQPNVASHHGMSDSPKRGMGSGMGGGNERPQPVAEGSSDASVAALLRELKSEVQGLRRQVGDINRRVDELHKGR